MRILAPYSRGTSALAQRHALWPVERTPQAVDQRSWHGPDRGVPAGWPGLPGRPLSERLALARAFVAKAVFNLSTTRLLIEMLSVDKTLHRLCGWQRRGEVPSEATFSRAFAEFATSALPSRLHEALIQDTHADRLVGHISRDSTAIEAREKPATSDKPAPQPKLSRKRGRPRKGEIRPAPPPSRIERQRGMTLAAMLADLPRACDVGA